jgi:hypothetical protein
VATVRDCYEDTAQRAERETLSCECVWQEYLAHFGGLIWLTRLNRRTGPVQNTEISEQYLLEVITREYEQQRKCKVQRLV